MKSLRRKKAAERAIEEESEEGEKLSAYLSNESRLMDGLDHTPKQYHNQYVNDNRYLAFPLASRFALWLKRLCCCKDNEDSFVTEMENKEREVGIDGSEAEFRASLGNMIPEIRVLGSSRLELDPNIGHPYVRVHFVDKRSGVYWRKKVDDKAVYHCQRIVKFNKEFNTYKAYQTDIIPPVSTNNCDFRLEGSSCCHWDDIFKLNMAASEFFTADLIILFQLLDFNHKLLVSRDRSRTNRDLTYPIAWGYLRPMGIAKRHVGLSKIQLYRYQCRASQLPSEYPETAVPDVYFDFIWPSKQKYPGFLTVVAQPIPVPEPVEKHTDPLHIFESEAGNPKYFEGLLKHREKGDKGQQQLKNKEMLKMARVKDQPCYLANEIYGKMATGQIGCYRLAFSNQGGMLVCACSNKQGQTNLKFFQTTKLKLIYEFSGHSSWIYSIEWSSDDRYLLTASSDRTAKLWEVPTFTQEFIDQFESEGLIVASAVHAGFVYSAVITQRLKGRLYFATATNNARIYLWECETGARQQILRRSLSQFNLYERPSSSLFGNCLCMDNGILYVGDTTGHIHALDIERDVFRRVGMVTNEQIEGVPISGIKILKDGSLLVSSRNNVVRVIELTATSLEIKRRFFGSTIDKQNVGMTVSPDGKYLLAGSEDGRPNCWQVESGLKVHHGMDLEVRGTVADCAWNGRLHMVAVAAFGEQFPAYVFVHRKSEREEEQALARLRVQGG